ncbi:response regulator [Flavobacterium sp. SUN052]|uniref:response regulator n=1 Tax=Flavobacterium sp. SUN052 TaxID=3002441 RepID=UPI00237ED996|nr:response regulator [Flavobacterium sp. SUN052]MEC4003895.1 response regulator [Flavobacterium sp. SUN052]
MLSKILFVDDDPITLMLCKKVIEKSEFSKEIITASNGEDALKYFNSIKNISEVDSPQLMFLDLNMPVMGGWEFLDAFTHENYITSFPKLKVIVLSSTIDPKDIEKSKSYPMVIDFLSKPITKEMLQYIKDTF